MLEEINFDGLIGPSHNYAGLSLGNLAATHNAGQTSHPREAALQGLAKMRACLTLGLKQGILLPHARPHDRWLASLGTDMLRADDALRANAMSASAMWAANAATVSPAPDCHDGRCHLTPANLMSMPHRSHEWPQTLAQLRLAFADRRHFVVHNPIPAPFGDEGAANHMRLSISHDVPGVEIFVYGHAGESDIRDERSGEGSRCRFPARQHAQASAAIARIHGVSSGRTLIWRQSREAIAAGAFHNDVVAVANGPVLLAHEQAFEDREGLYSQLRKIMPEVIIIEVPASAISLKDAVSSYLFNAQLLSLPEGGMALLLPSEARDNPRVWGWLSQILAGHSPITKLLTVDVRESMANGGGPACLRLRVVADTAMVDPRFLLDHARIDLLCEIVEKHWPEAISTDDLGAITLWKDIKKAHDKLLNAFDLKELLDLSS